MTERKFRGMSDFYPFYLGEHKNAWTKVFHIAGTIGFLAMVSLAFYLQRYLLILVGVVLAYALAWFSHFFIEGNRPATFKNPCLSLFSDFRMMWEVLTKRTKLGSQRTPRDSTRTEPASNSSKDRTKS